MEHGKVLRNVEKNEASNICGDRVVDLSMLLHDKWSPFEVFVSYGLGSWLYAYTQPKRRTHRNTVACQRWTAGLGLCAASHGDMEDLEQRQLVDRDARSSQCRL